MSDNAGDGGGGDNWVLGVTLGILGSVAINVGNNIQSLGLKQLHNRIEPNALVETTTTRRSAHGSLPSLKLQSPTPIGRLWPRSPLRTAPVDANEEEFVVVPTKKQPVQSPTWVVGTVIFVSGSLLNFVSYAFAAQSMLASLESVQFVTNLIFGKLLLKAKVTQTMLAGTALTVAGTVMAVQFSSKETLDLTLDEIIALYENPVYIGYLALVFVLVVVLQLAYHLLSKIKSADRPLKSQELVLVELVLPCIYAVSSSLFGTQSVIQAKVLSLLLQNNGEEDMFASWFTYASATIWILTVVVWLGRLNNGLKLFDSLFIIPLLQCNFIFFAILSGGIFFQEFNAFDWNQWIGFSFGIVVMFWGLFLLTPKPKSTQMKEDELQKEMIALVLESKNVATTPRSPCPTPSRSFAEQEGPSSNSEQEIPGNKLPFQSPSTLKETLTTSALAVFSGNPSTLALSNAMVTNTINADERRRRREALERLLELIKADPITAEGYSDEVSRLVGELNIDSHVPLTEDAAGVGSDIRDVARRLSLAQVNLQSRILTEIEKSQTPKVVSAARKGANDEDEEPEGASTSGGGPSIIRSLAAMQKQEEDIKEIA